jgi:hypothetical protein
MRCDSKERSRLLIFSSFVCVFEVVKINMQRAKNIGGAQPPQVNMKF